MDIRIFFFFCTQLISLIISIYFTLFVVLLVESLLTCQCLLDGQTVLNISERQ